MRILYCLCTALLLVLPSCYAQQGKGNESNPRIAAIAKAVDSTTPVAALPVVQTAVDKDTVPDVAAINLIYDFYHTYAAKGMTNLDSLGQYLTKSVIEKDSRIGCDAETGLAIRSQEYRSEHLQTLSVYPLGKGWYMAQYIQEEYFTYKIPMRVSHIAGQYKIDYISAGEVYGDSIVCDHVVYPLIDQSDPLAFIRSFYSLYMMRYAAMQDDLYETLAHLRSEHLTEKALSEFNAERRTNEYPGYDTLIAGWDFDYSWYSSVQIIPMDRFSFQINYIKYGILQRLSITLTKQGDRYHIDNIKRLQAIKL